MSNEAQKTRLRPPAYAKDLIAQRRRGYHPLDIDLLYGDQWSEAAARAKRAKAVFVRDGAAARPYSPAWHREVGAPMIALRPAEFAPLTFDFSCVTGARVALIDLDRAMQDCTFTKAGEALAWGLVYTLAGEVARFAAEVKLCEGLDDETGRDVRDLALAQRFRPGGGWPSWWSDETEAAIERRINRWYIAAFGRHSAGIHAS